MAFTPVANQLRTQLPDLIGVDQLKQKNALAERGMQVDERRQDSYENYMGMQGDALKQNSLAKSQESKQQAYAQIGALAQKAVASGDPRGFVADAVNNPAYQQLFQSAGIDPRQLDMNSRSFDQDIQAWASLGPQAGPLSTQGKVGADLAAGYLTAEQAQSALAPKTEMTDYQRGTLDLKERQLSTGGGANGAPSNVQEYNHYKSLSPEEQEEYLRVKRGDSKPSSALEKRLFDVNDAAFRSRSNGDKYENIASEMLRVMPSAGLAAKWSEKYKEMTGTEDAVTTLRKDWNSLRVSAAVQNLPPGIASDKDIALVMSAFLPENANPTAIASFMRGLSKLETLKADYHDFEAEYLSQNKTAVGLSAAWREKAAAPAPAPAGGGWQIEEVQ